MTDLITAAQQALEALEDWDSPVSLPAITALRTALAKQRLTDAQQEMERSIESLKAALAQQAEPVEPNRWEGDHDIESPNNACMHKGYCMSLKQAREPMVQQAEPVEPYCHVYEYDGVFGLHREFYPLSYNGIKPSRTVPVYTAPPQRKPLTSDKDRPDQGATYVEGYGYVDTRAVRAVERAHGIGDSDE